MISPLCNNQESMRNVQLTLYEVIPLLQKGKQEVKENLRGDPIQDEKA